MNSKTIIAIVAVIAVVGASAAVLAMTAGGGKENGGGVRADAAYGAAVWLDDGTKETEYSGAGDTFREIIEDALSGHDVVFNSNGNINSVDGVGNTSERSWVVFKWASPNGWGAISSLSGSVGCIDGMTLAVRYADRVADDKGNTSYSAPDIEVEYKAYFFIQFKEQYNSTKWMQRLNLDERQRQEGVWIEGTGSTVNEALADAVLTYLFPDSQYSFKDGGEQRTYTVDGEEGLFSYGLRPAMYGWFLSFFGWSDTKQSSEGGEYGTWTYWSQYSYHPDAKSLDDPSYWGYNQFSFGMYDVTKYRYFGLVLQTTAAEDDVDADLPAPSGIPKGL